MHNFVDFCVYYNMFSLVTERGKYLRVRKNVTASDVISTFSCPADDTFCGQIIALTAPKRFVYAIAGDTYGKIAKRESVDVVQLRSLNGNKAIYPTLRIWLP